MLVSNVNRNSIDDFDTSKDNVYEAAMELRDLFVFLEGNPTEDADEMMALMFERDYPHWSPIMVGFLELTDNPRVALRRPRSCRRIGLTALISAEGGSAAVTFANR